MKIISSVISGIFTGYLPVAFVAWNLDPGSWEIDLRILAVFTTAVSTWLFFALSSNEGGK